jgi:hypothetical protein
MRSEARSCAEISLEQGHGKEAKPYPTDLTDEQWKLIEPLLPPVEPGGRPRKSDLLMLAYPSENLLWSCAYP